MASNTPPELPEKLRDAVESLIRIATAEKFAIIGVVLKADPVSITVIRNTTGDPAELFHAAASLIQRKTQDGLVVEKIIRPAN